MFDIELLAERLVEVTAWLRGQPGCAALPIGYFGASTGAAAALWAAAMPGADVSAVVSRGGRPDLAGPRLADVHAPTLLIVGGLDDRGARAQPNGPGSACAARTDSPSSRARPTCSRSREPWSRPPSWPATGSSTISAARGQ